MLNNCVDIITKKCTLQLCRQTNNFGNDRVLLTNFPISVINVNRL